MFYEDEDGKFWHIKKLEFPPPVSMRIKHPGYWKKRTYTKSNGEKLIFDRPIRTGVCYFCKKERRAQRSKITVLHHTQYDVDLPLEWTIEVCKKCHDLIHYKKPRKTKPRNTGKF